MGLLFLCQQTKIILNYQTQNMIISIFGEMAERFKAHAWKACKGETLSWVRIPFSPPLIGQYLLLMT